MPGLSQPPQPGASLRFLPVQVRVKRKVQSREEVEEEDLT